MQSLFGGDDSFDLAREDSEGRCKHERRYLEHGPFGPHAAKIVCKDCGRMVRWASKLECVGDITSGWCKPLDMRKAEEVFGKRSGYG